MIPKLPSYFGLLLLYSDINILLIRPFQVISTNGYLFHYSQMGRVGGSGCSNWNKYKPIFNQLSTSIPPENIRKPEVFRGYRSGTWLIWIRVTRYLITLGVSCTEWNLNRKRTLIFLIPLLHPHDIRNFKLNL